MVVNNNKDEDLHIHSCKTPAFNSLHYLCTVHSLQQQQQGNKVWCTLKFKEKKLSFPSLLISKASKIPNKKNTFSPFNIEEVSSKKIFIESHHVHRSSFCL